ncbi:verprolin-like isoform X2 [Hordeum vulgare subsp. vulgare]|uniref:verprolin-like isoform X2 n=1 Tax=Hordeum vulgare subsp. vulgare TaxID=112509 RepID=UPI001D1A3885|nr:verprolin-like isoform X2 [Hordeum vulgare subsp. vulgare]
MFLLFNVQSLYQNKSTKRYRRKKEKKQSHAPPDPISTSGAPPPPATPDAGDGRSDVRRPPAPLAPPNAAASCVVAKGATVAAAPPCHAVHGGEATTATVGPNVASHLRRLAPLPRRRPPPPTCVQGGKATTATAEVEYRSAWIGSSSDRRAFLSSRTDRPRVRLKMFSVGCPLYY